jgi:hypothetical protein
MSRGEGEETKGVVRTGRKGEGPAGGDCVAKDHCFPVSVVVSLQRRDRGRRGSRHSRGKREDQIGRKRDPIAHHDDLLKSLELVASLGVHHHVSHIGKRSVDAIHVHDIHRDPLG